MEKDLLYVVFRVYPEQQLYSSLAQSVEHSAVNRVVVGSSPTGGVKIRKQQIYGFFMRLIAAENGELKKQDKNLLTNVERCDNLLKLSLEQTAENKEP